MAKGKDRPWPKWCDHCGKDIKEALGMCPGCDKILGGGIIEKRRAQMRRKRERDLANAQRSQRMATPDWVSPDEKRYRTRIVQNKKDRARIRNLAVFPRASEVVVTRADGTTCIMAAHQTPTSLRKVAPERLPIPEEMRVKILDRDGHACRYCGSEKDPFEMDHVLAVARGGATSMGNLVTACGPCNSRKGTDYWKPRPLAGKVPAPRQAKRRSSRSSRG